MIKLYK